MMIWKGCFHTTWGIYSDLFIRIPGKLMQCLGLGVLNPTMTVKTNKIMSQPFTGKEVLDATTGMSPLESLDPDDFQTFFLLKVLSSSISSCFVKEFIFKEWTSKKYVKIQNS